MKLNRRRFIEALAATPLVAGLKPLHQSPSVSVAPTECLGTPTCSVSISASGSYSPEREDSDDDPD